MACRSSVFFGALSLLLLVPVQAQTRTAVSAAAYGRLPMHFEENLGQTDARVRFLARGAGYAFFITGTETVAVLQAHRAAPAVIRMQLLGAGRQPRVEGREPLAGKSHYLAGNDPSRWRTDVPQFGKVRMAEVYRGIDVVWYGNQGEIEYDFLVAPGSDPRQIRMQFQGATRIETEASGDLLLHIPGGEIRQRAPFAYQERGGSRQVVQAKYRRLGASEFGITLGAYDPALPLVIDPVLAWSTYLGGSGHETAYAIAVDAAGSAYVTGNTNSPNFPTANALQAANAGGFDVFVTKLNAAGTALVYSTYLGGSGSETGHGIKVDAAGNAYVAGYTDSPNFPTANAVQAAHAGGFDAFVTKLNAAGSTLVYSSYLGGSAGDLGLGIAVDGAGNAYVTGETRSTNFPTANALQAANAGSVDAFVTKLNAAGSALVYSTYLGGSDFDSASGVAVDATGGAYVTGLSTSANFPTANAVQASYAGSGDAFVTKLNAAGTALVYSSYLGGTTLEAPGGIAVDGAGNAYVSGGTFSIDFPTANALQAGNAGSTDAFAVKLNAAGSAFIYSTYLGGSAAETAFTIAADSTGNAHLAGMTTSTNFPTADAFQPANAGATDAFVTKLDAAGSALLESTYLGGTVFDEALGIAVDTTGGIYVAGITASTDFPTLNPVQATQGGVQDAFVTRLVSSSSADLGIVKAATSAFLAGQDGTFTITVTNGGPAAATGVTVTDTIPAGATFVSATPSQGSCSGTTTVTCTLGTIANGASATIALVVRPAAEGPLSNTAGVTATSPDPNPANDSSTAVAQVAGSANLGIVKTAAGPFVEGQNSAFAINVTNAGPSAAGAVTVTDILPAGATFVSATTGQGSCGGTTTVTCTLGTIANGASATITLIVRPTAAGPLSNTATVSSPTADANSLDNASTAIVQVQSAALAAVPVLDGRTLMLLAALLASLGMWMVGRRT